MGRKKCVDPGNFPYQIFLNRHRFIQDFEIGQGGNIHVLTKGGWGERNF